MGYAFISYSTKNQSSADAIRSLFKKYDIDTWMAPYNIPAGSEYAEVLYDALNNCSCLVLLLTNDSQNSQWVRKEVNIAVSNGKTVIPVKLEDVELNSSMKLYLNDQQIVPVHVLDDTSEEVKRIIAGVSAYVKNDDSAPPVYEKTEATPVAAPPAPEKKEAPKKDNKKLFAIIGIAVALIAVIAVVAILLLGGNDTEAPDDKTDATSTQSAETKPEETDPPTDNTPSQPVVMSDTLSDFTIELEGTVYKIPCHYSEFINNGWTISSTGDSGDSLIGGNEDLSVQLTKDGKKIYANLYNYSGNTKKAKECMVGLIEVETYYGTTHKLAKNITTLSTADEIKEAFGIPTNTNSGSTYETLTYSFNDSYTSYVKFNIDSESKYSTIQLKNYVKTEADNTETNKAVPLYLSEYKAPSELGKDPTVCTFTLAGKVYKLSVPVSVLLADGWNIVQQPGYVVSGGDNYITIQKGNNKLELQVTNFAEYQTLPENCAVTGFSVYAIDEVDVSFPGTSSPITFGLNNDQIKAQLTSDFSVYEGTFSYSYSYDDYDNGIQVYYSVSNETGLLNSARIECTALPN